MWLCCWPASGRDTDTTMTCLRRSLQVQRVDHDQKKAVTQTSYSAAHTYRLGRKEGPAMLLRAAIPASSEHAETKLRVRLYRWIVRPKLVWLRRLEATCRSQPKIGGSEAGYSGQSAHRQVDSHCSSSKQSLTSCSKLRGRAWKGCWLLIPLTITWLSRHKCLLFCACMHVALH